MWSISMCSHKFVFRSHCNIISDITHDFYKIIKPMEDIFFFATVIDSSLFEI